MAIRRIIQQTINTKEVIITDTQLQHIMEKHPDAYEKVTSSLKNVLENPDFIIEDKHRNTGLIIKEIEVSNTFIQMVLRICTSDNETGYKNSIISCWEISQKRLQNYLKNKTILYKRK